jgi:predicted enzyme related to lactoylglutathione lyase
MQVNRIIADLHVANIDEAKSFYTEFLGLSTESFNMGWVARFVSPDAETVVQLITGDQTARSEPVLSVLTDDLDGAYAEAQRRGYEIVHPLTTEPWGVRRFFVRAPDGNILNVVGHTGHAL